MLKTQVLIIGGGATGTGVARDLSLRGIPCILAEKKDINAGASGGNHGLLHSGARYIVSDPNAAAECREEGALLKKLAPHCIENTGGLFVALPGDDEAYIADFPNGCAGQGITTRSLTVQEVREMEPALSDRIIAAFHVEDATIDPFRLSLDNIAHARQLGCRLLRFTRVVGFQIRKGRICSVSLLNEETGDKISLEAEMIVNAAGAWAGKVAAMAGAHIEMLYSKGSMLVTHTRITERVINRLRRPTDGDILVPGGTVSILGTTSERVASPDVIHPEIHEIDHMIEEGTAMLPALASTRYIRAYCGVRPLLGTEDAGDDRNVSRGFALIDHAEVGDQINNLVTITGGKLTTYRLMAEKAADLVCRRLGVEKPCTTREEPLPDSHSARWTQPGLAPTVWLQSRDPNDTPLCECEMVPKSVVEALITDIQKHNEVPNLKAIGLRSRVGKGPCQGTICSQQVTAHMYDQGEWKGREGMASLIDFLRERWRGQHALLWDTSLGQAELMEAIHCGIFGLELETAPMESTPPEEEPARC